MTTNSMYKNKRGASTTTSSSDVLEVHHDLRESKRAHLLLDGATTGVEDVGGPGDVGDINDDNIDDIPDEIDEEEIMRLLAENETNVQVEQMTQTTLKKMVLQLAKKLKTNQELRIKFSEQPEKFIDSELELNEQITKIKDLATAPELFEDFIQLQGPKTLISIMSHKNTDIVLAVLDTVNALTETDNFVDALDDGEKFVDALLQEDLCEMVVDAMMRIDESTSDEDFKGVTDSLGIIENLAEIRPNTVKGFANTKKFLQWLIKRIRKEEVDPNKVYAAEILAIIMSNDAETREKTITTLDGIDKLLRSIATYRKRDPQDNLEIEFVENIFDCLCQLMLSEEHQKTFGKAQGLDLMVRIMNQANYASKLSIKLTDMACRSSKDNCNAFVDKMGLKPLFAFFMRKGLKKKDFVEYEEYILGLAQSLLRSCSGNSLARVLNKFTEESFEKMQRVFEIHNEALERIRTADEQRAQDDAKLQTIREELDINEDEIYLERCENGLSTLQLADLIIVRVANSGNRQIMEAIEQLFRIKGTSKEDVIQTVQEYCKHLDPEFGQTERKELNRFLKVFSTSTSTTIS